MPEDKRNNVALILDGPVYQLADNQTLGIMGWRLELYWRR